MGCADFVVFWWFCLFFVGFCWSSRSKLPLLVSAADGQLVWQITQLERKPISPKTFEIRHEGYIRNDANQDLESD